MDQSPIESRFVCTYELRYTTYLLKYLIICFLLTYVIPGVEGVDIQLPILIYGSSQEVSVLFNLLVR